MQHFCYYTNLRQNVSTLHFCFMYK
uniref:Uncharacterized protein n=1 Tax=Anguilla anguilla TaxID=7936 RepID=A0A0E9QCK3_ANGAN